jgi:hypothetical protein
MHEGVLALRATAKDGFTTKITKMHEELLGHPGKGKGIVHHEEHEDARRFFWPCGQEQRAKGLFTTKATKMHEDLLGPPGKDQDFGDLVSCFFARSAHTCSCPSSCSFVFFVVENRPSSRSFVCFVVKKCPSSW